MENTFTTCDTGPVYSLTDIMTIAAKNDIKIIFSFNSRRSAYVIRIMDANNTYCIEQMILQAIYTPENVTHILKDMIYDFNETMKRRKKETDVEVTGHEKMS